MRYLPIESKNYYQIVFWKDLLLQIYLLVMQPEQQGEAKKEYELVYLDYGRDPEYIPIKIFAIYEVKKHNMR